MPTTLLVYCSWYPTCVAQKQNLWYWLVDGVGYRYLIGCYGTIRKRERTSHSEGIPYLTRMKHPGSSVGACGSRCPIILGTLSSSLTGIHFNRSIKSNPWQAPAEQWRVCADKPVGGGVVVQYWYSSGIGFSTPGWCKYLSSAGQLYEGMIKRGGKT